MAAVCNFSNLLTLIIFNGFSLQANRRKGSGGNIYISALLHPSTSVVSMLFSGSHGKFRLSEMVGSGQSFRRELLSHL